MDKLPLTCQHKGLISLIQPGPTKEGTLLATPRTGFPALPETEEWPNNTVNRIRAGTSSIIRVVKTGKLQQKSDNLREAMLRPTEAKEPLREAAEECEIGVMEGILT